MTDTVHRPSVSPQASSRPPWSPRGSTIVADVIVGVALSGVFDSVLTDRLGILPLTAEAASIALVVLIVAVVTVPWWAALARRRPMPKLPPVVPMEHSSALRRLYRRFGWVPLAPPIALGAAMEFGFRLNGMSAAGDAVVTPAMVLAPLAYIYWSGDWYR